MGCLTVEVLDKTPKTIDISEEGNIGSVDIVPIEPDITIDISDGTLNTLDVSCINISDFSIDTSNKNHKPDTDVEPKNVSISIEIGLVCQVSLGVWRVFFVKQGPFIVENGYFIVKRGEQ